VTERDLLAEAFEAHRDHLWAVAYRMLGSRGDAEDAVQETWLRLHRSDTSAVRNLGGWLTTVVGRICLDMLRARASRREDPVGADLDDSPVTAGTVGSRGDDEATDPERQAVLADSVGLALLVVLDTLSPAERLAFVLHDLFAVPFEEIAPIVERSPEATRQLASRARRRVRGASVSGEPDRARQRAVVEAFLAASREGDLERLVTVLDPEVVLRADRSSVAAATASAAKGAPALAAELRGAEAVAGAFRGKAQGAQPALVDGALGAVYAPGGRPRSVFTVTITGGRITAIEVVSDPTRIAELDVVPL
jgi:RNA polymerase sigma factor (sigma-70 family)